MSHKKKKKDIEFSQEEFTDIEFSQEEIADLLKNLANFEHKSLTYLAENELYEILPIVDKKSGQVLSKEEIKFFNGEIEKTGSKILYRIDKSNGETLVINPYTLKTMVYIEGMQ